MPQMVLLVTTDVYTPYAKGEVFGLPVEDAKKVLQHSDGRVVLYDEAKHADVLAAMSGKQVDGPAAPIQIVQLDPKTLQVHGGYKAETEEVADKKKA